MNSTALPMPVVSTGRSAQQRGLWLGLLGVAIFALTLPLTRIAVGTPDAPQFSAAFIALGRAAVAGFLSGIYLLATRAGLPHRADWLPLALVALGVVFGFPLCTSFALQHVEAVHASVVIGILPLATAVMGAWLHRQRPSAGFWLCAAVGASLVVAYALLHSGSGQLGLQAADGLLLLATALGALGYGFGAKLSQRMLPAHVICWALVISSPLTWPASFFYWPTAPISSAAWGAFAYVALFSMWLGFFAWYRGLALGGTVRVSQVQLLQPFLSMLFAVPLLGEKIDSLTIGFCVAVIATVFIGKKMRIR